MNSERVSVILREEDKTFLKFVRKTKGVCSSFLFQQFLDELKVKTNA